MDRATKILKKALELISYILIIGFVIKFFSRNGSPDTSLPAKLDKVSKPFESELEESEEAFNAEMKEVKENEEAISDMSASDLAAEFDSEF